MSKAPSAPSKGTKPKLKNPTWEYPKGSGIKIAEIPNKTAGVAYGVSYQVRIPAELVGIPGKRELHQRKTKAEAERLAEDRLIALRKHGSEFAKIPAAAQRQAAIAWGILDEQNRKAGLSLNLIDTVRAGIRVLSPEGGRKTVADVVAELTASKSERLAGGGLDSSTLHDFKTRGARITQEFSSRYVSDITHTEVADWLRRLRKSGAQFGGALSPRSVRNYRNTLSEIFRHAKARQYCADNPLERFTREDLKAHGGENTDRDLDGINILTVAEARKLLEAAYESKLEGMLGSLVLRLFCGLRTTEVCRLDWEEVHWLDPKPYVHIPAGKAKKRRVRLVDIPANALAWLRILNPPAKGRIVPGTGDAKKDTKAYCHRFAKVVKLAKVKGWENNDTRHSFGSYHFALHGDAMLTAKEMGHRQNDDMLFSHYRTLVKKEDAAAYFGLVPSERASKVTQFPASATA